VLLMVPQLVSRSGLRSGWHWVTRLALQWVKPMELPSGWMWVLPTVLLLALLLGTCCTRRRKTFE
jgi:hypothetical protein